MKDKILSFSLGNLCRDNPDEMAENQLMQESASSVIFNLSPVLKYCSVVLAQKGEYLTGDCP